MKIAKIIAVVVALAGLALSSCCTPGPPAPVPNMVMPGK